MINSWISLFQEKFNLKSFFPLSFIIIFVFLCIYNSVQIWEKDFDPELTFKSIFNTFLPNPIKNIFSSLTSVTKYPKFEIELKYLKGKHIDLTSTKKRWDKIDPNSQAQYTILIQNNSKFDIEDVLLTIQFPFYVLENKLLDQRKTSGFSIKSEFTDWAASPSLIIEKGHKIQPMNYFIKIHRISQRGYIKLLFTLNMKATRVSQVPPPNSKMATLLKNKINEFFLGKYMYKQKKYNLFYQILINKNNLLELAPKSDNIPENINIIMSFY